MLQKTEETLLFTIRNLAGNRIHSFLNTARKIRNLLIQKYLFFNEESCIDIGMTKVYGYKSNVLKYCLNDKIKPNASDITFFLDF